MRNCLQRFVLCAGLFFSSPAVRSEPPSSLESVETGQCRRNLQLVFEAIQAYRRVHQDIPNHLEELLPRFLSDPQYLICPTARRLGLSSLDLAKWKGSSLTTYGYELGPEAIPKIISGGSPRTMREWKRLQMGIVGSEVPMVRCQTHERAVLNLSFDGRIYETANLDWEPLFDDVVDQEKLWPARRLAAHAVVKKIVVPTRDRHAPPAMIDLSDHYNCLLDEIWPGQESLRPLAQLHAGIGEFNGAGFDVRGAIQLGAVRPGLVHYPAAVSNIVIGVPGRGVHLLLGAMHTAIPDTPVVDCVFHLAGGRQQRFRVVYGRHLAACISKREQRLTVHEGSLAWSEQIGEGQTARLYQCDWINSSPEQIIERMDFVAEPGNTAPFLVALTIEPPR